MQQKCKPVKVQTAQKTFT